MALPAKEGFDEAYAREKRVNEQYRQAILDVAGNTDCKLRGVLVSKDVPNLKIFLFQEENQKFWYQVWNSRKGRLGREMILEEDGGVEISVYDEANALAGKISIPQDLKVTTDPDLELTRAEKKFVFSWNLEEIEENYTEKRLFLEFLQANVFESDADKGGPVGHITGE